MRMGWGLRALLRLPFLHESSVTHCSRVPGGRDSCDISHVARPISLAVRLMGNMMADHKVVMSFFALVPILVPLPFMLLGRPVCLIQALVFCSLTMVYISMAIEHAEQ